MNRDNQEWMKKILAILAIVIIGVSLFHIVSVTSFNQHEYKVHGADESLPTHMVFNNREDSTSSWTKNNYDLYGKRVALSAQTFDATIYNHSSYEISTWMLRIDIKDDCFINNAWCGTMEIHQYTGTDREMVQRLDLRDYDLRKVKLDYLYDGDLLIPLVKGDYLIYYPSAKEFEFPIRSNSELTLGMIFYFLAPMDLSDYTFSYSYHEKYTEGIGFYTVIALLMLWCIIFTAKVVSALSYQRAWLEMESRKSGISYMSDIYEYIYIIDLENDEMIPLHPATESERIMIRNAGAREHLLKLLGADVEEQYKKLVLEFADLRTLGERLGKKSIACDYRSIAHGWCQARFFAMERKGEEPLERTIFTIQYINDEKLEMDRIEERISESNGAAVLERDEREYSSGSLFAAIEASASEAIQSKNISFQTDISPRVPEKLHGDYHRILRITEFLIATTLYRMEEGEVRLSVFAKEIEDRIHLLISVRASGDKPNYDEKNPGYGLIDALLAPIGSVLHVIREEGSLEGYYEIDQQMVRVDTAEE